MHKTDIGIHTIQDYMILKLVYGAVQVQPILRTQINSEQIFYPLSKHLTDKERQKSSNKTPMLLT
jgi:hypothetical protein